MSTTSACAALLLGSAAVWFAEPHTHTWTALALLCFIASYAGAAASGFGFCALVMNDRIEAAVSRWLKLT